MFKGALLAATLIVAGSTAMAADGMADSAVTPSTETACQPGLSLDFGCAMRAVDTNGDGDISAAELANLAVPSLPFGDWVPLRPGRGTGLDFKDATTEFGSVLPASPEHDSPQPLIPALLALGALVLLLRKRPL
jgi:hypothetical protein